MASRPNSRAAKKIVGWREWVGFPDLHLDWVKAKVDTGARSSALHALDIQTFERDGVHTVRFKIHPAQRSKRDMLIVELPVHDEREVRSSNGQLQLRVIVRPRIELFGDIWRAEISLTNRELMGFRMLLGREALRGRFLVDPARSYLAGRPESAE